MLNTPQGAYYISTWDEDVKNLKHYRWTRNQLSHEPNCTEQNMCEPEDELWLEEFYLRIMNQTDPLALYRKASNSHSVTKFEHQNEPVFSRVRYRKSSIRRTGCTMLMVLTLLIVVGIILFTVLV